MTRARGELPEPEEALLGIHRDSPEDEAEQQRTLDERIKFRRQMLLNLMQNQMFRQWLMETLVSFGTFDNAFAATPTGFPDPYATWFKAGMKAAGWSLWETFDAVSPEMASLMRREG